MFFPLPSSQFNKYYVNANFNSDFFGRAAVFGGLSVAGGAFAFHALKNQLSDRALAIFETGARYQMYHALALLLVALLLSYAQESQTFFAVAGWAFIAGTIIFSGSLYALSLTDTNGWVQLRPWGELLLLWLGVFGSRCF